MLDAEFTLKHAAKWAREVWGMDEQDAESFAVWYVREYQEEEDAYLPAYSQAVGAYLL